jgi:DNA modification methylase
MTARAPWTNRIVGSDLVAPDQLVANPRNWRTHPGRQRDALRGSLGTVGWVQQVLVNQRTGHVVDGHARVEEALTRGEATVPVLYVDLDPEEEAVVLATLDPIAAMAERDDAKLRELLAEVSEDDAGLAALLGDLAPVEPMVGLTDPDDVPEPQETSIKRGDLFALGDHRLMCGDSTSAEDVGRLLGGGTPMLLVTDPPYGVDYDPAWRNRSFGESGRSVGRVSNDDRSDWTPAWALFPGDVAYVWHAGTHAAEVAAGLASVGFEIRGQIIWAKPHFAISRGHYHVQHEPCWYAVRHDATASWVGDRSQSTLWEVGNGLAQSGPRKAEDANTEHSTQKPVELMRRALTNHSGDAYDPFLGSGTTIIAAEQLDRRCYAMDIDPRYVAVAIERWEKFTGQTAERIDG